MTGHANTRFNQLQQGITQALVQQGITLTQALVQQGMMTQGSGTAGHDNTGLRYSRA